MQSQGWIDFDELVRRRGGSAGALSSLHQVLGDMAEMFSHIPSWYLHF